MAIEEKIREQLIEVIPEKDKPHGSSTYCMMYD
jgi:hypothetical protein